MSLRLPRFAEVLAVSRSRGRNSENPQAWDGLIGCWAGLQGGGLEWKDVSGFDNHGTLTSMDPATDWVRDTHRGGFGSLDFDGSDYVVSTLFPDPRSITVAYWVEYDALGGGVDSHTMGAHDGSNRVYIGVDQDNNFGVGIGDSYIGFGTDNTASGLSTGTWYHFVVTGDGSTATIYIDGVGKKTFGYSASAASTNALWIGARNHATPQGIDGRVTDVSVYDRALSSVEVQSLYQDPLAMYRARRVSFPTMAAAGVDELMAAMQFNDNLPIPPQLEAVPY